MPRSGRSTTKEASRPSKKVARGAAGSAPPWTSSTCSSGWVGVVGRGVPGRARTLSTNSPSHLKISTTGLCENSPCRRMWYVLNVMVSRGSFTRAVCECWVMLFIIPLHKTWSVAFLCEFVSWVFKPDCRLVAFRTFSKIQVPLTNPSG